MRGSEALAAATGLLKAFTEAGTIHAADFHLACRMAAYRGESDGQMLLALALTVRELRLGSVCPDLACVPELIVPGEVGDGSAVELVELPQPEPQAWAAAVAVSFTMAGLGTGLRPSHLADGLLYLNWFFVGEQELAAHLGHRDALPDLPSPEPPAPGLDMIPDPIQGAAVRAATRVCICVITGGPGSGKMTVIPWITDALAPRGPITVALTVPTGKVATRLETTVHGRSRYPERVTLTVGTLRQITGVVPDRAEHTHDVLNPLPLDVVIVNKTLMMSIMLMLWLLETAVNSTRLVLIDDLNQLASMEAGAVLTDISAALDLTTPPGGPAVVRPGDSYRSLGNVARLTDSIRDGNAGGCPALLEQSVTCTPTPYSGTESLTDLPALASDVETVTRDARDTALAGNGDRVVRVLRQHRLLCACREGPFDTWH